MVAIGREVRRGVVERRQIKIGHKVHNRYDGTPMRNVVKRSLLAVQDRFGLHDVPRRSRFASEAG
jgi:hypothetical protein